MTRMEYLNGLLPIVYPSFYTLFSSALDELVFLNYGHKLPFRTTEAGLTIGDFIGNDKTQCEATNNHFHLFDKVGETGRKMALRIGIAIAQNLTCALTKSYPKKKFIVFLELDPKDSTIVRFHQIWAGELPYLDVTQNYQKGLELFEFRN